MTKEISSKILQYTFSGIAGFIVAIESALVFFVPAMILVMLDVFTAYMLSRRVKKKYPDKAEGKFKSSYINRIMIRIIIIFLAVITGYYIDALILRDVGQDYALRFAMGISAFYQLWSCLENWSSENDDNTFAKALQRIMINKAERHLNVPLDDIFLKDK